MFPRTLRERKLWKDAVIVVRKCVKDTGRESNWGICRGKVCKHVHGAWSKCVKWGLG